MINSEKAFDMLPSVVDIYDKLNIDDYRKKMTEQYKKDKEKGIMVTQMDAGIDLFKYVLRNSSKVKDDFFEIVSIMDEKSIEEVKKQPFSKTITAIKEIFTDKEAIDFFKQAMP